MKNKIVKSLSALGIGVLALFLVVKVSAQVPSLNLIPLLVKEAAQVLVDRLESRGALDLSANVAVSGERVVGGLQTTAANITDLTDISNLNNVENLYLWGKLEVASGLFVNSTSSQGSVSTTIYGVSNTGLGSIVSSGYFTDATNTQFCVKSPFGATSTARMIGIKDTGIATTSVSFVVATSTQSTGLSTSTVGFGLSNPAQLLNINLLSSNTATGTVFMASGVPDTRSNQGTPVATKITVAPNEYVCGVTGEGNGGSTAGVTFATNIFSGTFGILWERLGS